MAPTEQNSMERIFLALGNPLAPMKNGTIPPPHITPIWMLRKSKNESSDLNQITLLDLIFPEPACSGKINPIFLILLGISYSNEKFILFWWVWVPEIWRIMGWMQIEQGFSSFLPKIWRYRMLFLIIGMPKDLPKPEIRVSDTWIQSLQFIHP